MNNRGDALRAGQVYAQLEREYKYFGKFSTIKLPYIYKFQQEQSKDKKSDIQPPSVIKLFELNQQTYNLFMKLQPALNLLYEEFSDHQNVAHLKTELRQLKKSGFYFLEYRDFGLCLKDFLDQQEHQLEDKKVLDFSLQIAKGLAQLQFVGINHRDVKVSNVIICEDHLKVIDFDIARTQRSTTSKKKQTHNKLTSCYASPARLKAQNGEDQQVLYTAFLEDAYSFGLLMLQMILNKTQMQQQLKGFLQMGDTKRMNQKQYKTQTANLLQGCLSIVKMSKLFETLIEFSFSLICYDTNKRIDLLSVYKYLKHLQLGEFNKLQNFFQIQSKKSFERQYIKDQENKSSCSKLSYDVKKEYIFYPDHKDKGVKSVKRESARVATLNEKRNKLIIFDFNGNKDAVDFNQRTSTGTRVVTTNQAAYVMGGEEEDSLTNCKTLNICCSYKDLKPTRKEKIPDEGRSSFAIAFSFDLNMIALAGGFTKNSNLAQHILAYYPSLDNWNKNAKLTEKRVSPSACFTTKYFYVFGGMIESDSDQIQYSQMIEQFQGQSLGGSNGVSGKQIIVNDTPEFLKFIARSDSLAFHLQDEEVLVMGGVNDEEDDIKEGYRIDFATKEAKQIQEPMRNSQTSFYSPGVNHQKKLYVADMNLDGGQLYVGCFQKDYSSINFDVKYEI